MQVVKKIIKSSLSKLDKETKKIIRECRDVVQMVDYGYDEKDVWKGIQKIKELIEKNEQKRKEDKKIMNRNLARVIVCLLDDKLKLPSMMLESLEENLVTGNFDKVYEYYSNRLLELGRNKGE